MLRLRVLTALVLLPPLIAGPFLLSTPWLGLLLGAFVVVGAWEWAGLAGLAARGQKFFYTLAIAALAVALMSPFLADADLALALLAVAGFVWLWAFVSLARGDGWVGAIFGSSSRRAVTGALILVPCWLAALYLHAHDPQRPWLLLYLFVLTWSADTFAYFAGAVFGRTKLAPTISPGKTIEGLVGAMLVCLVFAFVCGIYVWKLAGLKLAAWTALAAVTVLASVLGDLVESKLKRLAGVKDSGHILPGHGGVLDRVDSFTASAPVFALGWLLVLRVSV